MCHRANLIPGGFIIISDIKLPLHPGIYIFHANSTIFSRSPFQIIFVIFHVSLLPPPNFVARM